MEVTKQVQNDMDWCQLKVRVGTKKSLHNTGAIIVKENNMPEVRMTEDEIVGHLDRHYTQTLHLLRKLGRLRCIMSERRGMILSRDEALDILLESYKTSRKEGKGPFAVPGVAEQSVTLTSIPE